MPYRSLRELEINIENFFVFFCLYAAAYSSQFRDEEIPIQ